MNQIDKIKVLLIDDRNTLTVPKMLPPPYDQYFEFRWLAQPEECREFRDLSWILKEHDPALLEQYGWIPEIMAIDYALTQVTFSLEQGLSAEDFNTLSPLPKLRNGLKEKNISRELLKWIPLCAKPPAGKEYWGCYIAGLILSDFPDHPCAPVTISAYEPDIPDTIFFEWMMATQTAERLKGTGKKISLWGDVLKNGVEHLQKRIPELAQNSIITIFLVDLIALSKDEKYPKLRILTKYGIRHLPIDGLFINIDNEIQRRRAIKSWAETILNEALLFLKEKESKSKVKAYQGSIQDINEGLKIENLLRKKWESLNPDEVLEHMGFSKFINQIQQTIKVKKINFRKKKRISLKSIVRNIHLIHSKLRVELRKRNLA